MVYLSSILIQLLSAYIKHHTNQNYNVDKNRDIFSYESRNTILVYWLKMTLICFQNRNKNADYLVWA